MTENERPRERWQASLNLIKWGLRFCIYFGPAEKEDEPTGGVGTSAIPAQEGITGNHP